MSMLCVYTIFTGSIFSRLIETPAKKLREFASASSSSLMGSMKTASRTPARSEVAKDGEMLNLSPPVVFKPQASYSSDDEESVPVRRSPRLRAMMQSKIKSSPNVRRCIVYHIP